MRNLSSTLIAYLITLHPKRDVRKWATNSTLQLEDTIRHHLNVYKSAHTYDPVSAGLPVDLTHRLGPIEPVLERLDPLLETPIHLSDSEFGDLLSFVRDGLLDQRAKAENLCRLVPPNVPSGMPVLQFKRAVKSSTAVGLSRQTAGESFKPG